MVGESAALGKALAALIAVVGLFACVCPLMTGKSTTLGKALAAFITSIGFLTRVHPTMDDEGTALGKTLTAHVAAKRPLARVRPSMHDESTAVGKPLDAQVAAIGFLPRVRSPMRGEIAVAGEALTALVTLEGFLAHVLAHMGGEFTLVGKAFSTIVAAEGLVRVHLLMFGSNAGADEAFATLVAPVRFDCVCTSVGSQCTAVSKALVTQPFVTAEWFVARMSPTMDRELAREGKALATLAATVRRFSGPVQREGRNVYQTLPQWLLHWDNTKEYVADGGSDTQRTELMRVCCVHV